MGPRRCCKLTWSAAGARKTAALRGAHCAPRALVTAAVRCESQRATLELLAPDQPLSQLSSRGKSAPLQQPPPATAPNSPRETPALTRAPSAPAGGSRSRLLSDLREKFMSSPSTDTDETSLARTRRTNSLNGTWEEAKVVGWSWWGAVRGGARRLGLGLGQPLAW
jgi:hypothetical protein